MTTESSETPRAVDPRGSKPDLLVTDYATKSLLTSTLIALSYLGLVSQYRINRINDLKEKTDVERNC